MTFDDAHKSLMRDLERTTNEILKKAGTMYPPDSHEVDKLVLAIRVTCSRISDLRSMQRQLQPKP